MVVSSVIATLPRSECGFTRITPRFTGPFIWSMPCVVLRRSWAHSSPSNGWIPGRHSRSTFPRSNRHTLQEMISRHDGHVLNTGWLHSKSILVPSSKGVALVSDIKPWDYVLGSSLTTKYYSVTEIRQRLSLKLFQRTLSSGLRASEMVHDRGRSKLFTVILPLLATPLSACSVLRVYRSSTPSL